MRKMLAEREGFEPSVLLLVRLISSQVHSTTLPPLRDVRNYSEHTMGIPRAQKGLKCLELRG